MIKIELPYPDKLLHPNSGAHWRAKMKAKEGARDLARYIAIKYKDRFEKEDKLQLIIDFLFTDARRRDLDNLLSWCKNSIDGVFLGLGVDDSQVKSITLKKHEKAKRQVVLVEILKLN